MLRDYFGFLFYFAALFMALSMSPCDRENRFTCYGDGVLKLGPFYIHSAAKGF